MLALTALIAAHLAAPAANAQCQYEVTGIITPDDADSCWPFPPSNTFPQGMNENGEVVGWYVPCAIGNERAFFWSQETGFVTLPQPPGAVQAYATDINDHGYIVGQHVYSGVGSKGYIYNPRTGEFKYLEPLHKGATATNLTAANAINNQNTVVGARVITEPGESPAIRNAVIWHPYGVNGNGREVVIDLGDFGVGPRSSARSLSDAGTSVVGWTGTGGDVAIPFRRGENGDVSLLDESFGLDLGFAFGVSNDDVVVGSAIFNGEPGKAFIWNGRNVAIIEPLPGFTSGGALGVNNFGQTLLACSNGPNHTPAIYQHGETSLLSDLMTDDGGLALQNPHEINDQGGVLVRGIFGSKTVGVLLAPLNRPITDLDADCVTDVHDLLMLLGQWGPCDGCPSDFTGNGVIGVPDLLFMLSNWD